MTRTRSVLVGIAGLVFSTSPSAQPPAGEDGQTRSLDRVRAGLRQELSVDTKAPEPTFRTEVTGHVIKLKDYWKDDSTAVGAYVHPTMSQAHGEYLNMMGSPVGATGRGPFARVNDPKQVIQVPIVMVDVTWLASIGRAKAREAPKATPP
jgi:hypothetical protein